MGYRGQEWAQKPLIYLPTTVSQAKRNKLASLGASLQFFGADAADTEHHARSRAQSLGQVYISPYNDVQVRPPIVTKSVPCVITSVAPSCS